MRCQTRQWTYCLPQPMFGCAVWAGPGVNQGACADMRRACGQHAGGLGNTKLHAEDMSGSMCKTCRTASSMRLISKTHPSPTLYKGMVRHLSRFAARFCFALRLDIAWGGSLTPGLLWQTGGAPEVRASVSRAGNATNFLSWTCGGNATGRLT